MFQTKHLSDYHTILMNLYMIAGSDDYWDMRIQEKLSFLLTLLMEDARGGENAAGNISDTVDIH